MLENAHVTAVLSLAFVPVLQADKLQLEQKYEQVQRILQVKDAEIERLIKVGACHAYSGIVCTRMSEHTVSPIPVSSS